MVILWDSIKMGFQFTPYIVVMLSAAVVCFLIGFNAWRRRDTHVDTMIIFIMMMAITEWLVASALGFATTVPASKITWAKIEYIGVVSVPLMVLIFAVNYSGLKQRLTSRNLVLIALVPAITLLLAWTNEMHGLIWSRYVPYQENGLMFSNKTYGPGFWVYWIYSYLLLLAATVLIIRTALFSGKAFRGQAAVLTIGILLPWLGNAIYVLHVSPLGNLDLTPLAFAFTGSMLVLGVVRWHLFDIKPTAHVAVIENMADGLILLNNRDRITDINPAALHIFRVSSLETIGKQGSQILPAELFSDELRGSDGRIRTEMKLPYDQIERHYEITGTPFHDKLGELMGRILIVHDVTELKLAQAMLHAAERKQADNALEQSEEKYRTLFEKAIEGILIANRETRKFRYANPTICKMLGYSQDELIGMGVNDIHPEDALDNVIHEFEALIKGEKILASYIPCQKKDGTITYADIRSAPASINGEECNIGFFIDITERKQAEEALQKSEAQYRLLSEHTIDFVWLMDMNLKPIYQSPSVEKLTGFTPQEVMELPFEKRLTPGSLKLAAEVFLEEIPRVMADPDYNPVIALELEVCRADGTTLWSENMFSVIRDEHRRPVSILGEARDITERKQIEEVLRESEAKYRLLADNTTDGIWLLNMDLKLIYCSPSSEKQSGFTLQEIMEMSLDQYFTPDSLKVVAEAFLEEMPKVEANPDYNPILTLDLEYYKKDGTAFWAESKFSIIRDKHGEPVSILGVARDITERKQAEGELQKSELRYRDLVNNSKNAVAIYEAAADGEDFIIRDFNLAAETIEKVKKEDIIGKNILQIFPGVKEFGLIEVLQRVWRTGVSERHPLRWYHDERISGWRDSYVYRLSSGEIVAIYEDVTARKQAEDALQQEHKMLVRTENIANIGSWEWDIAADIVTWSDELFRIFQRDPQAGAPSFAEHPAFYHPDDMVCLQQAAEAAITDGTPYELELRAIRKDGETRVCVARGVAEMAPGGRPFRLFGSLQDVTERKQAEEALRASELNYRSLIETSGAGVASVDLQGNLIFINQKFCKLTGYTEVELMGKTFNNYIHPGDRERVQDIFLQGLENPELKPEIELRVVCKNGNYIWLYSSPSALIAEGEFIGFTVLAVDITKRKGIELELIASRDQLRNLAVRLQLAREDERKNIALEIHDDLGQSLTALQIDLSWLIKRIPDNQEELLRKAQAMLKLVTDADRKVRELATGLRPPLLDDLGFITAAKSYIEEFEEKTDIKCEFLSEPAEILLDANVSLALFRVLQGSLINAAKHAKATQIKISMIEQTDGLYLDISDNGRGITGKELGSRKSIGIIGMRERMAFLGGSLQIEGAPEKGTTVKVKIPVQREMFQ